MAIVIHIGYVNAMMYSHKNLDPIFWPNYKAWLALKSQSRKRKEKSLEELMCIQEKGIALEEALIKILEVNSVRQKAIAR